MKPSFYFRLHKDKSVSLVKSSVDLLSILKEHLERLAKNSKFYAERLQSIDSLELDDVLDYFEKAPTTEKTEYRDYLQLDALTSSGKSNFVTDFSSGSTSRCVLRICQMSDDLSEQKVTEDVFFRAGLGPGDHFVCMDIGAAVIYDFYFRAARILGVDRCSFLHLDMKFENLPESLLRLKPTVLLTTPSLLAKLWPLISHAWVPSEEFKKIIFIGESLQEDFRKEIETKWGVKIYSFYGTTEIGGMSSNCSHSDGLHFDPQYFIPTLNNPKFLDEQTVQGEVLFTTPMIYTQGLLKYRVGDIVRMTIAPCSCGELTPRMWFVERTHDSFIIAGEKFRYQLFLQAFQASYPELESLYIEIDDDPDFKNKIRLTFFLPKSLESESENLLPLLRRQIFELDNLYNYGILSFKLDFQNLFSPLSRKQKKLIDKRAWMNKQE